MAEEPAHESRADALGERQEVGRRDGPGWQKRDAFLNGHEEAVGHARMEVDVAVQSGAEAVEEGDGAEPRAEGLAGGGVRHDGHCSAEPPLNLVEEDPREGGDGYGPVGEDAPQSLRHGDHPLPDGHRRDDTVGKVRGRFGHAAARAGRTDAPALAASHRQGGPSMAPSCGAADGNAKGSQGCRTRLSRDATRKPWPQPVQRARAKPQQRMPQRRYSRNSP